MINDCVIALINRHDTHHTTEECQGRKTLLFVGRLLPRRTGDSWFLGRQSASRLGLNGIVDRFSFRRLCDNLDPRSGTPVTVRMRSKRTVGYHFIFSVSKSVSLLHAMSGDHAFVDAFRAAVDETMGEMEGEMKTRVRKGRQDIYRTTGNMVWAEFIHTTSSPRWRSLRSAIAGLCFCVQHDLG